MKIAFIYDAVYPWEKGGAQKRIWELARRLADDHEVHMYGMHYWEGPAVIEREGVVLHGVCKPRELYVDGRRSIPQAIYFATALLPKLFGEQFDIIDCQEFPYFPCFVGKGHEILHNSTLVITWYEVWDDYWYDYLGRIGVCGKIIERMTARLAETVIPISEYIEDDLCKIGRKSGTSVVPNGVDFDRLNKIQPVEADWDIFYFGRLSEHKNVDVLLEVVAEIDKRLDRSVSCGIIGDGPERDSLEEYAEELGVSEIVSFLGFVEADEEVIGNLKTATVFVLPSEREGFPNTILEANAVGVPSIVVDHEENGSTGVVHDGETGFITELDVDSIAEKVEQILTDKEMRTDLSSKAREFGKNHDWDVVVQRLEKTYINTVR